jgi:hypothetical protein
MFKSAGDVEPVGVPAFEAPASAPSGVEPNPSSGKTFQPASTARFRLKGDSFSRDAWPERPTPPQITGVKHCYVAVARRSSSMNKSLQQHGLKEVYKQLRLKMKNSGLDTIKVLVTRRAGKYKFAFTGSPEQVVKADAILAAWA